MGILSRLVEQLLTGAPLTKGSARVMANKKMVQDLADAVRDDAAVNPASFPRGALATFKKMPNEQVAQWFLERLDAIEAEGYEGTIYSKDGVNSEWIARRYIAGSHNYEDIDGVMNMNLRDWYILKRRNLLEPSHQDLFSFKSVREVGAYVNTHYERHLADVRAAAMTAGLRKKAKSAKLVDNDDYKIYTVFNWAASRILGLGTQWCTANSTSDMNYKTYTSRAMVFQMYPKNPAPIVRKTPDGKEVVDTEKYQFDAGSPTVNNLIDHPVNRKEFTEKYPYVYEDLVKGLKENKAALNEFFKEAREQELEQPGKVDRETKITFYDVDDEIKKLKKLVDLGFLTDKKRPKPKPEGEEGGENPEMVTPPQDGTQPAPAPDQPVPAVQPQGQRPMENVDKDVKAMLESLKKYDKLLKESVVAVPGLNSKTVQAESFEAKMDAHRDETSVLNTNKEETTECSTGMKEEADKSKVPAYLRKKSGDKDWKVTQQDLDKEEEKKMSSEKGLEKLKKDTGIVEQADEEVLEWMQRFSKLGKMG